MKLTLYALLMVLLAPLLLLGLPFYMAPILMSRGRVSGTTYEPFNGRLMLHLMGSRPYTAALKLAGGLPASNVAVMALMIWPLVWASRWTGYLPGFVQYPPSRPTPMSGMIGARCEFLEMIGARCEFLDRAILDHVPECTQLVILGAGWDTRAYGLLEGQGGTIFEVDAPATQAVKRAAIEKTGVDASHVTFVSCDFNRQSWRDALEEHGFDPEQRPFILWEGVTMYLEEHAIESTLRAVSTLPTGSRIAFDFLSREWLEGTLEGRMMRFSAWATYGERFIFGFPVMPDFSNRLSEYLGKVGLVLERDRRMGDEGEGELPYGGLVLAVKAV
jgi:methyltransferase (TIGR00027 family)